MMGYAMPEQWTQGIHLRLRARAYVFDDGVRRIAYVSTDVCFTTQAVKQTVVERLKKTFGPTLYTEENVMLSATHTHAGPGGYSWHPMYDISTYGFHDQNFEAIVNGITKAIETAHNDAQNGSSRNVWYKRGNLLQSNTNRSPSAYLGNPASERAMYEHNTDKEFTTLVVEDASSMKTPVGIVGFFAVHGTSMNNTNRYISGDNKGYGSQLLEKKFSQLNSKFVGAVAQSNEGDVSPNIRGAFCDNGMPCEEAHSTCGGWSEGCHGYGPGKTDFESTKMIGENQFNAISGLYSQGSGTYLSGEISYMHVWVNMEDTTVTPEYSGVGKSVKTCTGALGDSFAAGTTDGPGMFDFVQGTNSSSKNWYWNWLTSKILAAPTQEDLDCHAPKPILILSGRIMFPGKWSQGIIPLQVFRIGNFWIVAVPGEFSTMSGRRLRQSVISAITNAGGWTPDSHLVIAGLSNSYTHYITTREEYAYQRYEGASTLFGPYTLNAYQMLYSDLANRMVKKLSPPPSAKPENISSAIFYLQAATTPDKVPQGKNFGSLYQDVRSSYRRGSSIAEVTFWAGNPRNNLHSEWTFLDVMQLQSNGTWNSVATDAAWETKFWFDYVTDGGHARIQWEIPADTAPGTYKIVHYGDYKDSNDKIHAYTGTSSQFTVA